MVLTFWCDRGYGRGVVLFRGGVVLQWMGVTCANVTPVFLAFLGASVCFFLFDLVLQCQAAMNG